MNKKMFARRFTAGLMSCLMMSGGCIQAAQAYAAAAEETDSVSQETLSAMYEDYYTIDIVDAEQFTFSEYYDIYSGENRPDKEIVVKGTDYLSTQNGTFSKGSYGTGDDVRDNVLIWESAEGTLNYEIEVEETGIYCVNMTYFPIESNSTSIELSMSIDGEVPYDTASRITLNRVWVLSLIHI